jgi:uncharacterized RmlC-like cupin family protein
LVADLLILAKTFYRTRFVPPGPARGPRKSRPMSAIQAGYPAEGPTAWAHAVRVVKAEHFDPNTAQTSGMHRVAAVSGETVGSKGIWAGITDVSPHAATGTHHHGEQETVIYVISGHVRMRWGDRLEHEADAGAGDFIYVSPFVPHQEINPADETSKWVIVRNGHDPIVINLEAVDDAQREATSLTHPRVLSRDLP